MNAPPAQWSIRRSTAADLQFILDLGGRTIGDSISELRPAPVADVIASFQKLIDYVLSQSHVTLIAQSSADPLGFLILLDRLPDEVTAQPQAFVAYMAVEPLARKRGVGRALLAAAEESARALGLPALALMVTENNEGARTLYARAGFSTERRLLVKPLGTPPATSAPER